MDFTGVFTFCIPIVSGKLLLGSLHIGHKDCWVWGAPWTSSDYACVLHISLIYGEESSSAGPTAAMLYTGAVMDLQPHAKFGS